MGYYRDISIDGKNKAMRVTSDDATYVKTAITGESVTLSAGAAGTTGVVCLANGPISNLDGGLIGILGDTSFAWAGGTTVLTTEKEYRQDYSDSDQFATMSNGDFAIDYDTGRTRYKKATTGTSAICSYLTRVQKVDTELTLHGDVIVDNCTTFATNVSDPSTAGYGLVDANGHLQCDILTSSGQYDEDSTHTSGEIGTFVLAVRNDTLSTTFTTTNGDYSPIAVSSKGVLFAQVSDGTNFMPTGDALARSLFVSAGDGTTTATVTTGTIKGWNVIFSDGTTIPVVETSGTKKALDVNITDGTNDMPTMDTAARAGFVHISDGTDDALVTGDKELYVAITERNKPAVTNATGAAAIATSLAPAAHFKLLAVTVHFSAAPTTSESLTITLNANDGAAYDTTLVSTNPSLTAATDITYIPDGGSLVCESGDAIDVAFTNTDTRTYGLRLVYQLL